MQNISYYPILKWKKGEQLALKELSVGNMKLYSVIELVDDVTPGFFFETLNECYKGAVYIDTIRCDENRDLLNSMIDYANKNDIDARPVLYPDDIFEFYEELAEKSSYLAIKIPVPEDFEGNTYDTILNYIKKHQSECMIDIFLDAGEVIRNKEANISFASYKIILNKIETDLDLFNNIIICLTSFPEKLDVESGGTATYRRYDIKIFENLRVLYPTHKLMYSDYGVTKFTETELDFSMMKHGVLPKIKYTTDDQYIVLKGEKDRVRRIYVRSTIDMAREIANSNYYSGESFSFGDAAIYEKANTPNAKPGGSTNWVTYCANHHLAFVMKQLSSLGDV